MLLTIISSKNCTISIIGKENIMINRQNWLIAHPYYAPINVFPTTPLDITGAIVGMWRQVATIAMSSCHVKLPWQVIIIDQIPYCEIKSPTTQLT